MATKKQSKKQTSQRKEILWNIINSLLAGGISLFSIILATNEINLKGIGIALATALVVAITQFKNYWAKEENEYCQPKIFTIIKPF